MFAMRSGAGLSVLWVVVRRAADGCAVVLRLCIYACVGRGLACEYVGVRSHGRVD